MDLIRQSALGRLPPIAVAQSDMLPKVRVDNWCLAIH